MRAGFLLGLGKLKGSARRVFGGFVMLGPIGMPAPVTAMWIDGRPARRIRNRMNAEKTIDAADKAADDAADKAPNRPRSLAAHSSTMRDTVGNSLRLRRKRPSE